MDFFFRLLLALALLAPLPLSAQMPPEAPPPPPESLPGAAPSETCHLGLPLPGAAEAGDPALPPCHPAPRADDLLDKGFRSARLDRNTLKNPEPLWLHGQCRFIDNRSQENDYFIPFASAEEWQAFLNNMPKWMAAYGCCAPRPLRTSDILTPPQSCPGGWHLLAIEEDGGAPGALMRPAGGILYDAQSVTVVELPLARDDGRGFFIYDGRRDFAARFRCGRNAGGGGNASGNGEPGEEVEDKPEEGITLVSTPPAAEAGEVALAPFRVFCRNGDWQSIAVRPCTESYYDYTASCATYGYPPGTPGAVTVRVKTLCPGGAAAEEILTQSCGGR